MRRRTAWIAVLSTLALVGCESSSDAGDDADGGPPPPPPEGAIELTDDNNYFSESALMPPEIVTASGTDLEIFWDDLTVDMQCHTVTSADIDKVALLRFRGISKEQAAQMLTAGELDMNDLDGYLQVEVEPDGSQTMCLGSDMSALGTPVVFTDRYVASDNHIYMMLWASDTRPGVGARTMAFLSPSEDEVNTTVRAPQACDQDTGEGILYFDATLPPPLEIPETATAVDWRGVEHDGLGNEFFRLNVDRVLIAFYEEMTPEFLQERIFDIETLATELWEGEHESGVSFDLRRAKHRESGEDFAGFAGYGEGTWLLALRCSTCQNPAPLVLTVLDPVPAE